MAGLNKFPFDMTPLRIARTLLEAVYDYATTDIALPTDMATFLLNWNELNIPDDVLFVEEDGGKGREDEPHITVKYGLLAKEVPPALREIVKTTKPFPITLGKISLFKNEKNDVVKLDIESPELHVLNQRISDAIPHEDTYPDYKPHATLAYVKPGSCDQMAGVNPFKAKGTVNQFNAPGMRFAGAGDSDDEARVEEHLLFSQTKHPGEVDESANRVFTRIMSGRSPNAREREISTVASSLVESWCYKQFTTTQMIRCLNEGKWDHGMKFWINRHHFPQTFKCIIEQTQEYIERVREAKFLENDIDPFGHVGFPTDPDRIRQFLRSNGKRRTERTLL